MFAKVVSSGSIGLTAVLGSCSRGVEPSGNCSRGLLPQGSGSCQHGLKPASGVCSMGYN